MPQWKLVALQPAGLQTIHSALYIAILHSHALNHDDHDECISICTSHHLGGNEIPCDILYQPHHCWGTKHPCRFLNDWFVRPGQSVNDACRAWKTHLVNLLLFIPLKTSTRRLCTSPWGQRAASVRQSTSSVLKHTSTPALTAASHWPDNQHSASGIYPSHSKQLDASFHRSHIEYSLCLICVTAMYPFTNLLAPSFSWKGKSGGKGCKLGARSESW